MSTEKQLYSDKSNHLIINFDVTNIFRIIGDGPGYMHNESIIYFSRPNL